MSVKINWAASPKVVRTIIKDYFIVPTLCNMCMGTLQEHDDVIVDGCEIRETGLCKLCDRLSSELAANLVNEFYDREVPE